MVKISFIALLFISLSGVGQSIPMIVTSGNRPVGIVNNIQGNVVPIIQSPDIEGSPFLCDEWRKGSVFFKKGKRVDSLPLMFDIQNNLIYFKQDSLPMSFLEEVSSFWFSCADDKGSKPRYFKSNYPLNGQFTPSTFYEVFVEGSAFHLLCLTGKKIVEEYTYNSAPKRKFQLLKEWYVYEVNSDQLVKIKFNKSALTKKFPSVATRINELCNNNKWELKTEDEMIKLFYELNN